MHHSHEIYMQRCLTLAQMGAGAVATNPMVGAVLVHDGIIIGEGYHQKWGDPHAEVVCMDSVKKENKHLVPHATLYVSLEPCSHYGKTPPCADLIIRENIKKVVVGCTDPFGLVAGKGIEKLQKAGVEVIVGVLEAACIALNKHFFTFNTRHRPYITLKWAQSADCKIAAQKFTRLKISNEYSARLVHRLRSQHMAILIGTNTALFDDPELTTRHWPGQTPVRLVVDKLLRLPASLRLFDGQHPTIVFNLLRHRHHYNLTYYQIAEDSNLVHQIVQALYSLKLNSVLVEGGTQLLQSFIDAGLWDEAIVITNQRLAVGEGLPAPQLHNHALQKVETLFNDTVHTYTNHLNNK